MTPETKMLVQKSFEQVLPMAEAAAELFYFRLFKLDPALQNLFRGDMAEQGHKLMNMLRVAVAGLDRLDTLIPAVQKLGQRHVGYGVRPQHYQVVGEALLWTLEAGLGDSFTAETAAAWAEVYATLSGVMQEAAFELALS